MKIRYNYTRIAKITHNLYYPKGAEDVVQHPKVVPDGDEGRAARDQESDAGARRRALEGVEPLRGARPDEPLARGGPQKSDVASVDPIDAVPRPPHADP